jgi:hypothetical protein
LKVALQFDETLGYGVITLAFLFMELEQLIGKLFALRQNLLSESIVMGFDGIKELIGFYF